MEGGEECLLGLYRMMILKKLFSFVDEFQQLVSFEVWEVDPSIAWLDYTIALPLQAYYAGVSHLRIFPDISGQQA